MEVGIQLEVDKAKVGALQPCILFTGTDYNTNQPYAAYNNNGATLIYAASTDADPLNKKGTRGTYTYTTNGTTKTVTYTYLTYSRL